MAEQKTTSTVTTLTEAHLDKLIGLMEGLKSDARQAEAEKDVFMLGVYRELLRVASPIVTRAHARLDRQEQAEINRAHKHLRKSLRDSSDQSGAKSEQ